MKTGDISSESFGLTAPGGEEGPTRWEDLGRLCLEWADGTYFVWIQRAQVCRLRSRHEAPSKPMAEFLCYTEMHGPLEGDQRRGCSMNWGSPQVGSPTLSKGLRKLLSKDR